MPIPGLTASPSSQHIPVENVFFNCLVIWACLEHGSTVISMKYGDIVLVLRSGKEAKKGIYLSHFLTKASIQTLAWE